MNKISIVAGVTAIIGLGAIGTAMTKDGEDRVSDPVMLAQGGDQLHNVALTELEPLTALDADSICSRYMTQESFERGGGRMPATGGAFGEFSSSVSRSSPQMADSMMAPPSMPAPVIAFAPSSERYDGEDVAGAVRVADNPVSTFSIDVDTASYANARRFLSEGRMPPAASVRTEEMLNYFRYDYETRGTSDAPFDVSLDVTRSPWNTDSRILRVGLTGDSIPDGRRPPANLVFLVDVSGSMNSMDKLPLVKCSLALAAERLAPEDSIAIVAYSGWSGVVLEPTSSRQKVLSAIDSLASGGSTGGEAAIRMAYDLAHRNFRKGQVNRIIMATDGDFNVGISDKDDLVSLVENERRGGVSLTTLGFGTGNLNDAMMEQIADHGNGNYFYIDSPAEARKVLDEEMVSTIFTIAKDVKVQVEFNPAHVSEYRLIGYENRTLREEDFANDQVDAGEIGSGHQVTALYEIIPAGGKGWFPDRRYAANRRSSSPGDPGSEVAMVSLRYKQPDGDRSTEIGFPATVAMLRNAGEPDGETAFALAVAGYGQRMRGDEWIGDWSFADSARLAQGQASSDIRRQFVELARRASEMERKQS